MSMTKRSVVEVLVLSVLTVGIYYVYWLVKTKDEMVVRGADVPTGWLLIIPIVSIYWKWKWSQGVERVTRGRLSAPVTFLLVYLFDVIGMAIVQHTFNELPDEQVLLPEARIA
jgi:hypothetical protein